MTFTSIIQVDIVRTAWELSSTDTSEPVREVLITRLPEILPSTDGKLPV